MKVLVQLFWGIVLLLNCQSLVAKSSQLFLKDENASDKVIVLGSSNTTDAAEERELGPKGKKKYKRKVKPLKIINNYYGVPLGPCQGVCTVNEDCEGGLVCYYRSYKEKVPGCRGRGKKKVSYCTGIPLGPTPYPPATPPPYSLTGPPTLPPPTFPPRTFSPTPWPTSGSIDPVGKHFVSKIEGPYQTLLVGAAAAQLPDGRVLLWSSYARYAFKGETGDGKTITAIFDPATGRSVESLIVDTQHNMFCPGTAMLSDGKIMVTGGSGKNRVTLYDPISNVWSIGMRMTLGRGYHAMTPLSDGSIFTHGGSWGGGSKELRGDKDAEIRSPSGAWTLLTGIKDGPFLTDDARGGYRADNHMWLFQAPNGLIFHAGPSKQMHWIDVQGYGSIRDAGFRGDDDHSMCGTAVMYDVGLILTSGGSVDYDDGLSSSRAYVIDISGVAPIVQRVGDMNYGRTFHSSVLLPSGEVFMAGGQYEVKLFRDKYAVFEIEIWSPATRKFTKLNTRLTVPRNYHSAGVLLKDGRVLMSGGGLCGDCSFNHPDAEIITPTYLLNADGTPATRPVIKYAPTVFTHGRPFSVTMNTGGVYTFALVRLGISTHGINNDQRRIPLDVVTSGYGSFVLKSPSNPHVVLPGRYYLFAMNANGVPSYGVDMMRTPPDQL